MWDQCVPVKVVQWDDLKDNDFMSKWALPKETAKKKEAEVVEDLSIDKLGTSLYIYNLFVRHHLDTVKEILQFTNEEWWHKGGVGQKCWPELERVLNILREYREKRFKDLPIDSPFWDVMISFDTPLTHIRMLNLTFSRRLEKAGLITIDDMLHCRSDRWENLRGIDKWHKRDYLADAMEFDWDIHHSMERRLHLDYEGHLSNDMTQSLISLCDHGHEPYQSLLDVLEANGYPAEEKIRDTLWQDKGGRQLMASLVFSTLEEQEFEGLPKEDLLAAFPERLRDEKALDGLLQELAENDEIFLERNLYFRRYLRLSDFITHRLDANTGRCISYRLQGRTLEETAHQMGITKERVRQLQGKVIAKVPLVEEMRYMDKKVLYEGLTDEDFSYVFQLPVATVSFLALFTDESARTLPKRIRRAALAQVEADESLPEDVRERAKKRKEELHLDVEIGAAVAPASRSKLFPTLIPELAKECISYNDLIDKYNAYVVSKFPNARKELLADEQYAIRVSTFFNVLTSSGKRLRYYPIADHDYAQFFYELNLKQFEGLEISTRKLFLDHLDLMNEYDIRNYQELHNLLKKWQLLEKDHEKKYLPADMVMVRTPTIRFGKTDRTKQVKILIEKYHPSKQEELVRLIAKEYGINPGSILANGWLKDTGF